MLFFKEFRVYETKTGKGIVSHANSAPFLDLLLSNNAAQGEEALKARPPSPHE